MRFGIKYGSSQKHLSKRMTSYFPSQIQSHYKYLSACVAVCYLTLLCWQKIAPGSIQYVYQNYTDIRQEVGKEARMSPEAELKKTISHQTPENVTVLSNWQQGSRGSSSPSYILSAFRITYLPGTYNICQEPCGPYIKLADIHNSLTCEKCY